jgi:hypothetical protein
VPLLQAWADKLTHQNPSPWMKTYNNWSAWTGAYNHAAPCRCSVFPLAPLSKWRFLKIQMRCRSLICAGRQTKVLTKFKHTLASVALCARALRWNSDQLSPPLFRCGTAGASYFLFAQGEEVCALALNRASQVRHHFPRPL